MLFPPPLQLADLPSVDEGDSEDSISPLLETLLMLNRPLRLREVVKSEEEEGERKMEGEEDTVVRVAADGG